jgi:hypothetical protein
MTNFYSLEMQIKNDWNIVRAFVALHPYVTMFAALAIGWLVGRVL